MNKLYMGVDIGSSSSKAAIVDGAFKLMAHAVVDIGTGTNGPEQVVKSVLDALNITEADIAYCVATGYGRMRYEKADKQLTEISCHAKGVFHSLEGVRTIIDIGGQDVKAISVNETGRVENCIMNEKCAAGTGRFLETMARVLGVGLGELDALDQKSEHGVTISSICTVFAESEVISRLSEGALIEDVVRGVHNSVAERTFGLLQRLGPIMPRIAMTGGVALNGGVVRALERMLAQPILLPELPRLMGAYGAAIYAVENSPG